MDNTQTEAMQTADGLANKGNDIISEVREETNAAYDNEVSGVEAQPQVDAIDEVDYSAPEQNVESESVPLNEWEVEAKKFQSM